MVLTEPLLDTKPGSRHKTRESTFSQFFTKFYLSMNHLEIFIKQIIICYVEGRAWNSVFLSGPVHTGLEYE